MSLPSEKANAVRKAYFFMCELVEDPLTYIRKHPREIRRRAGAVLRHFPWAHDTEIFQAALEAHDKWLMQRWESRAARAGRRKKSPT